MGGAWSCRRVGWGLWKPPFAVNDTLSGIETGRGNSESWEQKAAFESRGNKSKWGPAIGAVTNHWETLIIVPFSLDLRTWEKVDSELEKPLCKGVPLPVSIWLTWALIKSVLEPLQIPESSEGSEDESEIPSEGGPENAEPKGVEQKTQEALKTAVPSVPLFEKDQFPPPPPALTAGAAQAFPSLQQTAVLSPLQKGACWTRQEGDLEAMIMAFLVTIHERIATGTDPNNPTGVCEAIHRFSSKY